MHLHVEFTKDSPESGYRTSAGVEGAALSSIPRGSEWRRAECRSGRLSTGCTAPDPTVRAHTAVPLLVVLAGAGLFTARRVAASRQAAEREAAMETLQLRVWAQSHTAAGVSIQPKKVPPADRKAVAALRNLPGYHAYAMRCESCHVLPSPTAHAGKEWIGTVDKMRFYIGRAGVVPPADSELGAIKSFLQAASDSLQDH